MAIKSNFTLRLELIIHAKLRAIAKQEKRSVTNLISFFLLREIERYEAEFGKIIISEDDLYD